VVRRAVRRRRLRGDLHHVAQQGFALRRVDGRRRRARPLFLFLLRRRLVQSCIHRLLLLLRR
jgi:hypothetical protein